MKRFKYCHFPDEVVLMAIRWYCSYPLSYRHIEDLIEERGVNLDHATANRWICKYSPGLVEEFRQYKGPVGTSWRMDETYIQVKGVWVYYYRAVDKEGKTIDFYLSELRDTAAAKAFFDKAIGNNGVPEKVNIDKSGANLAGIEAINKGLSKWQKIFIRQVKYLNNIVEQDHRAVKRITRPMMGFKSFASAAATLAGIELCHMMRKDQSIINTRLPAWKQFYVLFS